MQKNTAQPFAHFGDYFLKTLDDLESQPLLYVDCSGWLLAKVALRNLDLKKVKSAVRFALTVGAKRLIRAQQQSFNQTDPFQIESPLTKLLYESVKLYRIPFSEFVLIEDVNEKLLDK